MQRGAFIYSIEREFARMRRSLVRASSLPPSSGGIYISIAAVDFRCAFPSTAIARTPAVARAAG